MANLLSFSFKRELPQDSDEALKEAQPKKKSRPNGAHRSTGFDDHWLKKFTWLCYEKCDDGDFDCERAFSALNRIKTQQRNRLCQKVLNSLMMLSTQGPASVDYPYKEAAAKWTALKNRRIEFEL